MQLRNENLILHPSLQGRSQKQSTSPTLHEQHVARTFALSYQRLVDIEELIDMQALALLARAASFAPGEPIPYELLVATLNIADESEPELQAQDAVNRLVELGVLEEGIEGMLRMHRLLAAFVQTVSDDEVAQAAVEQTIIEEARRLNDIGTPLTSRIFQPHLRFVTNTAKVRNDALAADLCLNYGEYLQMLGDHSGAKPYFKRALNINEKLVGPNHQDTATSLTSLANLMTREGDYKTARLYYERALSIREQVLGGDHPDTAITMSTLASELMRQGEYATAKSLYERALAIRERVLEADHPDLAFDLAGLGWVAETQSDYAQARVFTERALAIRERSLPTNHFRTAISHGHLATILVKLGDYALAKQHYEKALSIFEQSVGLEHPRAISTIHNMAKLLQLQGDYQAAQHLYEHVLSVRERVLGIEHHYTGKTLNNLGFLLFSQKNNGEARSLFERALSIRSYAVERRRYVS